jgi:hypothetical protein
MSNLNLILMRILPFACLAICAFAFLSCSSSNDSTGASTSFRPAKGSLYVFQQEDLDSNGNVQGEPGWHDNYYRVSTTDTTMDGHAHAYLITTNDSLNGTVPINHSSIAYLDNGDIESKDGVDMDVLLWLHYPIATHTDARLLLDSMVNAHTGTYHFIDTTTIHYSGDSDVTINGQTVHIVTCSVTFAAFFVDLQKHDTTIAHGTRTMQYAPSLGYFTHIESRERQYDNVRSVNDGYRRTMQRYELK